VRGDSLRDLYAKVLAILGLGMLAGVGALVDYWPVATGTPTLVAGPQFLPALPALTPADSIPVPAAPAMARAERAVAVAPAAVPAPESIVAVALTGELPVGEPLTLSAPPPPAVVAVSATEAPAAQIELPAPPVIEVTPAANFPNLATANQPEPGFFMGALRKTRAGLVKTGAVTGASIMDVFKGVVGVFKKVSPFKDRSFGTN
jgi:hypothetical protein